MIVRICPYCDQRLKKKHHCDNCNSFVWKANTMEVHEAAEDEAFGDFSKYKTSENTASEYRTFEYENSEYKTPEYKSLEREAEETGPRSEPGYIQVQLPLQNEPATDKKPQPSMTSDTKARGTRTPTAKSAMTRAADVTKKSDRKKSGKGAVAIIVIVFVVIGISWVVSALGDIIADYEYTDVAADEAEETSSEIDLTSDDLANYTQNCTEIIHLDINGEELLQATETFLEEKGYDLSEADQNFYGYADRMNPDDCFYEWEYHVYLDENYDQFMQLSYDGVTGDVHEIRYCLLSQEEAIEYLLLVFRDFMGVDTVETEELETLFSEDSPGGYCMNSVVSVYQSSYSGGYTVNIEGTQEPYDYAQEPEERQLTQQEVTDYGRECNSSPHLDIAQGEDVTLLVENWMEECGYTGFEYDIYSTDTVRTYTQLGGLTYDKLILNTQEHWYNYDNNMSVWVETDTYSGRLHRVSASNFDEDSALSLLELMTEMVGKGDAASILEMCQSQLDEQEYAFVEIEDLEFYMALYDGDLTVQMYGAY